MSRGRRGSRRLRVIAGSFTVAAPSGAKTRDRLRLSGRDERVVALIGGYLGGHARADLAGRVRTGDVPVKDNRRAGRKKALTGVSSSRWAGSITRASEDRITAGTPAVVVGGKRALRSRGCGGCWRVARWVRVEVTLLPSPAPT